MGFNSGFKGLNTVSKTLILTTIQRIKTQASLTANCNSNDRCAACRLAIGMMHDVLQFKIRILAYT